MTKSAIASAICGCAFVIVPAATAGGQEALRFVPTDAVKWIKHPPLLGARLANVVGDPSKPNMIAQRFKSAPNFKVAPHTQTRTEIATMLSDTLHLGDLPLKVLAWEVEDGTVRVTYNPAEFLRTRHSVEDRDALLEQITEGTGSVARRAAQ